VEGKAALLDAGGNIRYQAQPVAGDVMELNATNGFFDRCFEAKDPQPGIPGDEKFIGSSFGHLAATAEDGRGTARWHLWFAEKGEIQLAFHFQVPAKEAKRPWTIKVGAETKVLTVNESDGKSAQTQTLTFHITQAGKCTIAIDCTETPPAAGTQIHSIAVTGSPMAHASLLRTRWRPAAVHARFTAPQECPAPFMWVFETRSVTKTSSYSPLTTPFGYYGTSFQSDGMIRAGAGFNFSMWIAGNGAAHAPPLEQMSRLIATGIPEAEFSTFGGEGTGVKFRGATAYKTDTDHTIQALRIEHSKDDLVTYYGYFYDEPTKRWKLYASAQKPAGKKNGKGSNIGVLGGTGSFCEIPGPPNKERSGDVVREIKRRGWFYGNDAKWYRAELGGGDADANLDSASETTSAKDEERSEAELASAKRVYYMSDYATEGWMSMATGGIELFTPQPRAKPKSGDAKSPNIPDYLTSEKTAQLFELPVMFGPAEAKEISSSAAVIDYEIKKTGPNSKAILYYGTVDCLTFPPKSVTKGSPAEIDMARPERTWQFATAQQSVAAGNNRFALKNLTPKSTYFFRLFVTHDEGKSWDYDSGKFTTEPIPFQR
jgi:hypothetical protein